MLEGCSNSLRENIFKQFNETKDKDRLEKLIEQNY